MSRTTRARRTAAALTLVATTATTAATAAGALGAPAGAAPEAAPPQRTTLTFTVDDCDGCTIRLEQGRETDDAQEPAVWSSKTKEVKDGEVSFTVRSKRTRGMSVLVRAPWEGQTGYVTTVAMRYAGNGVGEKVTFKEARDKTKASACWEGVRSLDELTIPLVVREVEVAGVHEQVPGSIAFVKETQSWLDPMRRAPEGVLGSQDTNICR